jgi:HSP20 family protein
MLIRTAAAYPLDQSALSGTWSRPASPPVDVVRTAEEFLVTVDLPGVSPDAIDIEATATTLVVRAERRPTQTGPNERLCVSERRLGAFARHLVLAAPVDAGRVSARYEDGVLTVRLPLANRSARRRIPVTTGAAVPTGGRSEDGVA